MPRSAPVSDASVRGDFVSDDCLPSASLDALRLRAELLRHTRAFFESRGFLEVETPLLSQDTVVDRHLDPFPVTLGAATRYLQTSPEFCMKRLLAAGAEAIFQVTRAFRQGEHGPRHNPEFTMVEWYRAGDTYERGQQLLAEFAQTLLCQGSVDRLSYQDAFQTHAGVDPHRAALGELRDAAARFGLLAPSFADADRDTLLNLLLAERVEPNLGRQAPLILCDYPASQAALAKVAGDPPVARRFELYYQGVELANGYDELLDPDALRQRNARVNQQRQAAGHPALPTESRLLAAMTRGLPACVGVALGFDRLVMLRAGKQTLAEVLAFPWDRA